MSRMMRRTAVLAVAVAGLALASCVPPDQMAWRRCEAAGMGPGTDGGYGCYDNEMDRIERSSEQSQAAGAALMGAGLGLVEMSQPRPPVYVIERPVW